MTELEGDVLLRLVKDEIDRHIKEENEVRTPLGQSDHLERLIILKRSLQEIKGGKVECFLSLGGDDLEVLLDLVKDEITQIAREGDPCGGSLSGSPSLEKVVYLRRVLRDRIDSLVEEKFPSL